MAVTPIAATSPAAGNGLGLDFQSLLQIILTQLTAQNPLQPLDNFQFVSQLAEFSQLQLSQSLNDSVTSLLSAQSATQAVGLLGHSVDVTTGTTSANATTVTGNVQAVTFTTSGQPQITIQTASGQTVANVSISQITQVR